MSYELDSERTKQCPCGKGTLVQRRYSNDWNQERIQREICCNSCAQIYRFEEESKYSRKGELYTVLYLLNKNTGERTRFDFY